MKKTFNKKVALISRDKFMSKLLNFMLNNSSISAEHILSASELNETYAKKDSTPPNLIIYDCDSSRPGEELTCQPLKDYRLYNETPKLVISTFKVDCCACTEFTSGKCANIQKPFKVSHLKDTVKELVRYKSSD